MTHPGPTVSDDLELIWHFRKQIKLAGLLSDYHVEEVQI